MGKKNENKTELGIAKPDMGYNDIPKALRLLEECRKRDKGKVRRCIDKKTYILVNKKNNTDEYAERWKKRYEDSQKRN